MLNRLSTSHYLLKLSENDRKILAKKIGIVINMLHSDNFGDCCPSLEQCYTLLGRMQTRLRMLHKVVDVLTYRLGTTFKMWPAELYDLRQTSEKQIGLMEQLIDCYLAKNGTVWSDIEKKENDDSENHNTIKEFDEFAKNN